MVAKYFFLGQLQKYLKYDVPRVAKPRLQCRSFLCALHMVVHTKQGDFVSYNNASIIG